MSKDYPATVVGSPEESITVRVRQVVNGFITERSSSGPDGYKCQETFSKTRPSVAVTASSDPKPVGSSSMKAATRELRRSGK